MALAPETGLAIGSAFQGGYEILSQLGAGSFGWVYRARQLSTGQDVAIKVVRVRPGDTPADVENQTERFRREMRLCAGLAHPNIVRLIDSGETDGGMLYAVFEYVPGTTLKELLATSGKLGLRETLHLMTQVLDALSCAHARGVVHRDLKPENIMVTKTGARRNALVLDFGLGGFAPAAEAWAMPRLTATHEILGTPCYAAPEQLRGQAPSTRSDLYSWGLILLECLTGELAVSGASGQEVLFKQLGPDPIPIPDWLRRQRLGRLLAVVTAKQVEKRDVTIEGLLEALDGIESDSSALRAMRPERLPEGERRQLTMVSCRLTVSPLEDRALDVEELDELVHAQHAIYGEFVARAGGQIASVLADRLLVVFGYPQAEEHDARRAVQTALHIAAETERTSERLQVERRIRLDIRLAVHTGVVIARELRQVSQQLLYEPVGLTPQVAARLEELARPGEILISDATRSLLRGDIAVEPAGELRVAEHLDPILVFRLLGKHRTPGLETIPRAAEAPLVGRAHELGQLRGLWEQVQQGRAGAVLINGEPGIGKSRLVRELRRHVTADSWLECRCVAENQASPLRPVVDLLLGLGEPIESLLTRLGFELAEAMPLFAGLLSIPLDDRYAPLGLTPDRQKELTFGAILSLIVRIAQERPLVLAFEDLHWADPTTLELVTQLVQEVRSAELAGGERAPRLCALFTARTEFSPPWSRDDTMVIQPGRLGPSHVEELVTAGLATDKRLPPVLLEQVIRRSDGVPLFVEEVTRMLLEAGARGDDGEAFGGDGLALEIPVSLRDLLTARLDRLSPSARDTIQLAAILGREFRYELLSAVARKDESLLRDEVRELIDSGLLYTRRSVRAEAYLFKHALVREAAYESMRKSRRQLLHGRIASTLRERFPDIEQQRPEVLAQHFEQGGETHTAVEYWTRAGEEALRRAGYAEARVQLERGLALLETLPQSPERTRVEVALLTVLGTVQLSTQGQGTDEVLQTFARARRLCDRLGGDLPIKVLNGLMTVPLARGDQEATDEMMPHVNRLTARVEDTVACISGHAFLGLYAFWVGDFAASREHMEVGTRLYGTEDFQRFARDYGWDGGLFCHAYRMTSLWHLGYPLQAETARRELIAIAEPTGNPYSILLALGFSATLLYDLGEIEALRATSDRVIAFSTEQRLYPWLAGGLCGRGAALIGGGDIEEAIAQIRQGIDLYAAMGVRISHSYYLTYLATAYRDARRIEDGLGVVDEGLALCRTLFARFHESELLRLKGELLDLGGDAAGAEAALRAALEVTQPGGSKAFALRAATSLARFLRERGREPEAREFLAGPYSVFTEGFETRDMRVARGVLRDLGGASALTLSEH